MKRYSVIFEESAQADIRKSYEWGVRAWGTREAEKWIRELRSAVFNQLRIAPKGFALAPEDNEFPQEIRQMIVGRYRILFTIKERKIHVLHVRGAYVAGIEQEE